MQQCPLLCLCILPSSSSSSFISLWLVLWSPQTTKMVFVVILMPHQFLLHTKVLTHTQTTSTYACKREASMPRFWCEGIKRIFSVLEIGVKHTGCFKRCNFPIRLFYQEVRAQFDLFLFFPSSSFLYMQRDNNAKGKRWWWFTPVWHTVRCTKYFYDRLFSPHIFSKKLLEHLMKCDVFRN